MRLRQLTWLLLLGISLVVLALPLWPGMVMAQEVITAQLDPVGDSGVSGMTTLIAAGDGTNVKLDIKGLAPGADARATMHANTCAMPSASFATLPYLKADASGRATATGSVLFRGTENVALATMADGEHIITIQAGGQVVACGVIPNLTSGSVPPTLPVTGGASFWLMAAIAGALGLCVLSGGLFLRQHSQGPHTTQGQVGLVIAGTDGQVLLSGRVAGGGYDRILPTTQDYMITVRAVGRTSADYTLDVAIPPL